MTLIDKLILALRWREPLMQILLWIYLLWFCVWLFSGKERCNGGGGSVSGVGRRPAAGENGVDNVETGRNSEEGSHRPVGNPQLPQRRQ